MQCRGLAVIGPRRADGDGRVRVEPQVQRSPLKGGPHQAAHRPHLGRAAYQDDVVNVSSAQAGGPEGGVDGLDGALRREGAGASQCQNAHAHACTRQQGRTSSRSVTACSASATLSVNVDPPGSWMVASSSALRRRLAVSTATSSSACVWSSSGSATGVCARTHAFTEGRDIEGRQIGPLNILHVPHAPRWPCQSPPRPGGNPRRWP